MNKKRTPEHKHFWHYLHTIYEGRGENDASVVRYCNCGKREHAFTGPWTALPKGHDAHTLIEQED